MRYPIDDDPITRIHQEMEDGLDGNVTIITEQDIEPILQRNLDLRNLHDRRAGWKGDMHHVASIPNVIMDELIRQGIANDKDAMKKWLNDPKNEIFRTRPGKV